MIPKTIKENNRVIDLFSSKYTKRIPNTSHTEKTKRVLNIQFYLQSWLYSQTLKKDFNDIKNFCLFIGYSRSGHSILGSIIDAHKNAVIGHEVDCLYLFQKGYSKNQIYSAIVENSKKFNKYKRGWSGYSYHIPNSHQGKYTKLILLGDKMGGWLSQEIKNNPQALNQFQKFIKLNFLYIHHFRNPFDNISRIALINNKNIIDRNDIDIFFDSVKSNMRYINSIDKDSVFFSKHENLIDNPEKSLISLFKFLKLSSDKQLVNQCKNILFPSPSTTRYKIKWSANNIEYCNKLINQYSHLKGYYY